MLKFLFFIGIQLLLLTTTKADYHTLHDNAGRFVNGIQKIDNNYYVYGQGEFIGYINNKFEYTPIQDHGHDDLAIMSLKSCNSVHYLAKSYNNGVGAWIEKTNNFEDFNIIHYSNNFDLFTDIEAADKLVYLVGLNLISQEPFFKYFDGQDISNNILKKSSLIPMSITQTENGDIYILNTNLDSSKIIIFDNLFDKKQEIAFDFGKLTDMKIFENNLYLMSEFGKLIKCNLSDLTHEVLYNGINMNEDAHFQIIDQKTIFACSSVDGKHGILLKTTDGGNSWEEVYKMNDERFTCFLIDGKSTFIGTYSGKIISNEDFSSAGEWEVIETNRLKVFPNPSTDFVTVDTKETIKSFKLIDMLGNDVSSNAELNNKSINVSNLSVGTYTLIVNGLSSQIAIIR